MMDRITGGWIFLLISLCAIVTGGLVYGIRSRPSVWKLAGMSALHGLVCLVVLQVFNAWTGYFSQNADAYWTMGWLSDARDTEELQPFLLIDNSGNKQLVPTGNAQDSTLQVITDRRQLARLLQLLSAHQADIAQVVCDITFEASSPQDSSLREAIRDLAAHGKILIAGGGASNAPLLQFNAGVIADVTEMEQDGAIAWHQALRGDGRASLPYMVYSRLYDRHPTELFMGIHYERGPQGNWPVYGGFMPTWAFLPPTTAAEMTPDGADADHLPLSIGYALGLGRTQLEQRIALEHPVIFIGDLSAPPGRSSSDSHRTFRGAYGGGYLLIDLVHELERGGHRIRSGSIAWQFVILWACSWIVFCRAWPCRPPRPAPTTYLGVVRAVTWKAFKGTIPLLLLLVVAWWLRCNFDQHVNLALLLVYFVALEGVIGTVRATRSPRSEGSRTGGGAGGQDPPLPGRAGPAVNRRR